MTNAAARLPSGSDSNVELWTDGGCWPNPGPGGWAAITRQPSGSLTILEGCEPSTTNNRMELTAVLEGLRALPDGAVGVYCDSAYVRNAFTQGWLAAWQRNDWTRKVRHRREPVKNADLWRALGAESERFRLKWHYIRGHTGLELNELADQIAARQVCEARLAGERLR